MVVAVKGGIALAALVLLAGCGDFERGDAVEARIRLDPSDHCRVIISSYALSVKAMATRIEGCEAK